MRTIVNARPAIPDHTLLRPIGRGAYGEVWLARNVMGVLRAVKVIWRRDFESERPYEREFAGIQRYEPVSRSSGGLVHVLHVGRNDAAGYFYQVMELADAEGEVISESVPSRSPHPPARGTGGPLGTDTLMPDYSPRTLRADLKRLSRLSTEDCLRLAIDVASGLAQLHRHGLVHRDVKPGNIIFVHGHAKLADIGLVSAGGEGRTFVGTEGYIPPEGPGTPVADLYALGVVLYEASTGFSPERFPDVPPEWLHDSAGDSALELHEIILKAGEGQRERRYQSAEEIQADLALLQSGQSVRQVRALERRVAWARRIGWAAAFVVALAVGGALFAGWRARVARQMSAKEAALRQRAESAELDARQKLYSAYLAQARATVFSGEAGRQAQALQTVRQAAAIRNAPELRRVAFSALTLPDLHVVSELDPGSDTLEFAVDPTFRQCAIARRDHSVQIFSFPALQLLARLPATTNRPARALLFSPAGRFLAFKRDVPTSGGDRADLEVWDLGTTRRVLLAERGVGHVAFAFHPQERHLAAGRPDGQLVIWDLGQGGERSRWPAPRLVALRYSPDGERLAMSSEPGAGSAVVAIRDANTGVVLHETSFPDWVLALDWHPDGEHLAVPCANGTVNLLNTTKGYVRLLGRHHAQAVRAMFARGGDYLFSVSWDNSFYIWNLRKGERELTASLQGTRLQFDEDGRHAALHVKGRGVLLLDFALAPECRELRGDLGFAGRPGAFSADGRWLALPTVHGVAVWDLAHAGPPTIVEEDGLGRALFAINAEELFGWTAKALYRWRVTADEGKSPPRLEPLPIAQSQGTRSMHVLEDSIVLTRPQGVKILPLNQPAGRQARRIDTAMATGAAVSADGAWLATPVARGSMVRVLRLANLADERWLSNAAPARWCDFSPSGRSLAIATLKGVELWDTASWRMTRTMPADTDVFTQLDFSPDGRLLIVMENARSAGLFDARTLEPVLPLPAWTRPLAMSEDSRQLAVSVDGGGVQIWDLPAVRARFRELGIDWPE